MKRGTEQRYEGIVIEGMKVREMCAVIVCLSSGLKAVMIDEIFVPCF